MGTTKISTIPNILVSSTTLAVLCPCTSSTSTIVAHTAAAAVTAYRRPGARVEYSPRCLASNSFLDFLSSMVVSIARFSSSPQQQYS